mgnify:CR=1 FL=1
MSNIHRTAKGTVVDMARLKTINETVIAVGNAGTNARGDLVKGGKILKTREELTKENYNLGTNNTKRSSSAPLESLAHADTDEENFINPPKIPDYDKTKIPGK